MNNITIPTGGPVGGFIYRIASGTGADNDIFTSLLRHLYEWNVKILLKDGHVLEGLLNGEQPPTHVQRVVGARYGEVATEDDHGVLWGSLTEWNEAEGAHTGPVRRFCWDDVIVLEVQ
jgi:hypothetical protein